MKMAYGEHLLARTRFRFAGEGSLRQNDGPLAIICGQLCQSGETKCLRPSVIKLDIRR